MQDAILTMLQSVIILAVTLLSTYATKYLNAKAEQAKAAAGSEAAARYIGEASDAVSTAVLHTAQTYVDALKKGGAFNVDEQKTALQLALATARGQLTQGAEDFIKAAYGDVNGYLEAKIEAEIKAVLK